MLANDLSQIVSFEIGTQHDSPLSKFLRKELCHTFTFSDHFREIHFKERDVWQRGSVTD
jgi:hypothetical protein